MKRKLFALAGFASGALAGRAAYRRWFGGSRERLDVYFDDGSFVTFGPGSPEADRKISPATRYWSSVSRPANSLAASPPVLRRRCTPRLALLSLD